MIGLMASRIDYSKHTEAELVEMFGRLHPLYAPDECARLGQYLTEKGYVVTQGETEPGFARPSAARLQALIGSSRPLECAVEFGKIAGPMSYLAPALTDLGFVGAGKLRVDGVYVYLFGRMAPTIGIVRSLKEQRVQLPLRHVVNVESQGPWLRFEYRTEEGASGAISFQLADESAATALAGALPKTRTPVFRPQIQANAQFTGQLTARSPRTPVTFGLIAVNSLIFVLMLFDGAGLLHPNAQVHVSWGSNFSPYTTGGQWWRLLTSVFIHFGVVHIIGNMLALASFGPLVERFYGSQRYLLIYLLAGIFGSFCSVYWHPLINSAGASGAIFGILGALLATLLSGRDRIPPEIIDPLLRNTLLFIGWSVYNSFKTPGIDYVAHMGGFAAGFVLGWVVTPKSGREVLAS